MTQFIFYYSNFTSIFFSHFFSHKKSYLCQQFVYSKDFFISTWFKFVMDVEEDASDSSNDGKTRANNPGKNNNFF